MSLPAAVYRDIGEEVPASDRIIYAAFLRHLEEDQTTPIRAILRAAADCGVRKARVVEIVRQNGTYTGI